MGLFDKKNASTGLTLGKAHRSQVFLKLGLAAPSGGGKTIGALLVAYGLMAEKYPNESDAFRWSKIAIVDTENKSGQLYANTQLRTLNGFKIGEYNAVNLSSPYTAEKYIQAIDLCEEAGMEVCIIDSSTHLWSGEGGLLEQQGNAAKRTGNSYTAWRDITPMHNRFVERMLQSNMHIIATMRSKQEYVQEKNEQGKTSIRKVGLEPEQRKGMEYEFTTFFEINNEHEAFGSKDRTGIFDQLTFKITPETGATLMHWLETADTVETAPIAKSATVADVETEMVNMKKVIIEQCKALGGKDNNEMMEIVRKYAPKGNPNSITDLDELKALNADLAKMQNSSISEEILEDVEETK